MIEISAKSKFLLVSADPEVLMMSKAVMKKAGFSDIVTEESGIVALKLCAADKFDVVVCDVNSRFIPGWLFIQELKNSAITPNCTTILMGRDDSGVTEAELRQYGVPGYLKFPFVLKDFMALLSTGLADILTVGSVENKYTAAKQALIEQKSDKAVDLYTGLQGVTKSSARSSIGLALAYEQSNDIDNANAVISQLADSGTGNSPSQMVLTFRLAIQSGDRERARKTCMELLELTKDTPLYFLTTLEVSGKHDAPDLGGEISDLAIARGFRMVEFEIGRAKRCYSTGDLEETLKVLRAAKKQFPQTIEALNLEGVCLRRLDRHDSARRCYEDALTLAPADPKVMFNLALVIIAQQDFEFAATLLRKALKVAPNFSKAAEKLAEITPNLIKKGA